MERKIPAFKKKKNQNPFRCNPFTPLAEPCSHEIKQRKRKKKFKNKGGKRKKLCLKLQITPQKLKFTL